MKRNSADSRNQFRRLAVLIAVNFVDMIGFMIVLPLLPFYALKLHATPETIGRLIASFSKPGSHGQHTHHHGNTSH